VILKRCPSCRTLCDAERDVRCFACGGELTKEGPPAKVRVPEVLRISRRDRKSSSALLITFAVFGGFGVFSVVINPTVEIPVRIGLGVLLFAAVVLGALSSQTKGTAIGMVGSSLLKLLAFFGILVSLVVGLMLLLIAACATGLMR
jgi:hypothetical protein